MSSNGDAASSSTSTPTAAIGVGFSSIGGRHGESSSRAASKSSSRSSERRDTHSPAQEEPDLTPPAKPQEYEQLKSSTGSIGHRTRKSGGFLLDSAFANGSPRGGAELRGKRAAQQDGQLRVDKRRAAAPRRLSGASSLRSSPLSQEVSVDGPADEGDEQSTSRPPSMDTTQLVQMALNLSESRKRNVSNSLRVPSGRERSISPALMSSLGTVRASPSSRNRSSQVTDDTQGRTPSSGRTREQSLDMPGSSSTSAMDNVFYTFSPATLARAEKARKYFELASDHRRLLQSLPPLKPDSSAPLGRAYNPIQSLRNRRIRLKEKRPFPAPPETWQDIDKVNGWINDVESVTFVDFDPDSEDVHLPTFAGEDEAIKAESRLQQNNTRHHRSDTIASVITRPENLWTIEPAELLADAYWTEHGDNKAFIETRDGKYIFPDRERHNNSTPRISVDLHRGRNESVEWNDFGDDLEEHGKRRRKLILPLTAGERRKARRLISRSSSSSSGSSKERRASGHPLTSRSDENIGPLEKHMQELIEKDAKGELSSPEMSSPDHWKSKNKPSRAPRPSFGSSHRGSFTRPEGRASLEVPREIHGRSRSADGRVGSIDQSIFSTDDNAGSEPASPKVTRHIPSIGMDLTLPSETRRSFEGNRPRGPTLPSFRPQNKEKNKIAQTDFAEVSNTSLSPILSASYYQQRFPTPVDDSSPDEVKRQRTNESWMGIRRYETGGTSVSSNKESASTVSRFLRSRRGKFFGNKDKVDGGGVSDMSANVSDVSDAEDVAVLNGKLKRRPTNEDSPESARDSPDGDRLRPKFHLSNLPSFTSSAVRDRREKMETPGLLKNDPLGGAMRRPEKFDRVLPPIINLPDGTTSNADLAVSPGNSISETRRSYGELQPLFGEIPRRSLLTGAPTPGISQSKRHWSIYDNKAPIERDAKIAPRDIARVRALLLASGIKAREIIRRADDPRDPPSAFLTQATSTTGQEVQPVVLKEEPLIAAQLLGTHLSTSLTGYETTISNFQTGPARDLGSQLEDLRQRASDHLSKLTHDTSDEADAFTIELNTRTPQQAKRVDDAVDEILRRRRRQLRVLRITAYKLLEWLVVGIFWWIWFLVALFNFGRKIVVGIWRVLRWLFSL